MLFSPFTFRLLGQPSDPETAPLVPARYAGDITLASWRSYNTARPHRRCAAAAAPDIAGSQLVHGRIRRRPILGGLLNEYEAAA